MTASAYRYRLPRKAIKGTCPQCGRQRALSRYVDNQTGEALPDEFGRCDREDHCGYHLSPYHKIADGLSYADSQNPLNRLPKEWFRMVGKWKRSGMLAQGCQDTLVQMEGATDEQAQQVVKYVFSRPSLLPLSPLPSIHALPNDVFCSSVATRRYGQNQFYLLLSRQFGMSKAHELMQRFQIGTSSRWPGACVFWVVDLEKRARGGQVVLFADDWHKARYTDVEGNAQPCISSVGYCLLRYYQQQGQPVPDWLTDYQNNADRWPVPFGLSQLREASADAPIAIVEAPKTAVVCSAHFPDFVWLAIGGKSYLKPERLEPLRGRKLILYPDLNAFYDTVGRDGRTIKGWSTTADELRGQGFRVEVSSLLEEQATDQQRANGLDLADFLLEQPPTSSGIWPPPGSQPQYPPNP
ncbi:putative DNA-binding protein [Fibrella aestuarina BUZ 2]|uniref:Putative DNA-binding protein n=1 Tax=Fibrella aestuarina BUZ 2 TaxID=1166018 RepID=I0K2M0_9BACT|nr:DUF6371 domain-containing protein [Fibrella aestuarina]CCG98373.1 putative DNA-binding protein [Fibrella aestuarina BUZ 2]